MGFVTEEIENALELLSIENSSFQLLSDNEANPLFRKLLDRFVSGGDRRWWWESFSLPEYSLNFDDQQAFQRITTVVPDPQESVWIVIEDDQLPIYPIYEGSPENIQKVIGECYGFEYYIISKSMTWLLCENHHNRMLGIGDEIIDRMKGLDA